MTTREIKNLFYRFITDSDADFGWVIVCIGDFDPRQAAGDFTAKSQASKKRSPVGRFGCCNAWLPYGLLMILHIEPGCIDKDGIYVLEEQVLVTESGGKVLSHAPWELRT